MSVCGGVSTGRPGYCPRGSNETKAILTWALTTASACAVAAAIVPSGCAPDGPPAAAGPPVTEAAAGPGDVEPAAPSAAPADDGPAGRPKRPMPSTAPAVEVSGPDGAPVGLPADLKERRDAVLRLRKADNKGDEAIAAAEEYRKQVAQREGAGHPDYARAIESSLADKL